MFRLFYSKPLSHLSRNSISAYNAERGEAPRYMGEAPRYLKKKELVCELDGEVHSVKNTTLHIWLNDGVY